MRTPTLHQDWEVARLSHSYIIISMITRFIGLYSKV